MANTNATVRAQMAMRIRRSIFVFCIGGYN